MTGVGLSRSLRQCRAAISQRPILVAGLALTMVVLAGGDLAEVIPFLAPVVASPYFSFIHETHDLVAMLLALYVAYRLLPALGAGLLLLFVAVKVPYFYLEFPQDLPEYLNTVAAIIVGLIGIRLIAKLQELHAEVGAKAAHLSFLRDLTSIMNSGLDMDEVYRTFASRLKKSVPLDRVAILWVEGEQARVFSLNLDVPSPEAGLPTGGGLIPLEGTGLDWLTEHRQPLYQPDLAREGQFTTDAEHRGSGLRSYLRLPLLFQGEVIGALNLGSKMPDAYGAEERQLLEALAAQIAPTVAHTRLYEGQKRRTEQLAALHQVSQAVGQSLDLEAVAAQALEAALHVLGLDAGAIRYVDEATQELVLLIQRGLPPEMLKERQAKPRVKIGESLAGRVAQSGEILVVDDFSQDSRSAYQSNRFSGFQSFIGFPLKAQGRVVGTMSCLSRRSRTFTPGEMEMVASLGNMVGVAIANARLFEQVEAAGREWEQTFNAMSDGIAIHSPDFRIVRANGALAGMLGTSPEALVGQHCYEAIHGLEGPIEGCPMVRCLSEKRACEWEAQEPRLGNRWLHMRAEPVLGPQGEVVSVVHTVRDITERKQAEEALKEAQKVKDEFVSTVSHELRTPLTSIRGSLGLLAGGLLGSAPEKGQHMLDIAVSNTDRLIRLINDILDFERMQSGKITMTREVCQAADMVSQTEQLLRAMAQEAGVTLSVSSDSARLWADPDRVIQTLTNLVGNAIKFSPRDTTVRLTAERQGDHILFKVADQGPGIPADKLDLIFERFQQADASLSRAKGGAGLGLAICRSIVERHGGRIWVESTYGEGSTFFFTLPVLKEVGPVAAAPESSGPTVLVCDDDPPTLEVVGAILEGGGYRAITVLSGQEAIEQAAAQQPAAIVLDLIMPGMDGWETLAALRERPETKDIPVVILSVLQPHGGTESPSEVVDWLGKPVDEGSLFQALRRAVGQGARDPRVLVVEDDLDLAKVLTAQFQRHGIEAVHAETGRQAIQLAQRILPDILVLDLILPEGDGFEVVDWLRLHERLSQVALVVYTAKDITKADRKRLRLGETLFLTKGHVAPEEFQRQVIGLLNRMVPTKGAGVRVEA